MTSALRLIPRRALLGAAALVALAGGASPAWAATSTTARSVTPRPAPLFPGAPARRPVSPTDQLLKPGSSLAPAPAARGAVRTAAVAPFLTRPYLHAHTVTSVFDHCSPNYTTDGKICEYDGTVALKTNGVDPTFVRGYAITPGGSDYLYYDGHDGWDIGLNYENLLAAADGTVSTAGNDAGGFGLNVTIDHGNGFTTRYGHMSLIGVSVGQRVSRGQLIGVSGNTGNSTGPHLHFGLYRNSPWAAIDPWGWTASTPDPNPADAGDMWIGGNPQDPPVAGPPTGVTASISGQTATVAWTPPTSNGGTAITSYTLTSIPDGLTASIPAPATTGTLPGLGYSTSYTFTVTAVNAVGPGTPSAPSAAMPATAPPPFRGMYTLDGYGGVHPVQSPTLSSSSSWPGWNIARSMGLKGDATGGYLLDGWGGIHPVGNADPNITGNDYWSGWDIARDIAVLPDGSGGYVLDGWGHLHPFATGGHAQPPVPVTSAYWHGWDIARKVALFPDGSGGYILDGWGGLHPFATGTHAMPAAVQASAYWQGWDIARGITLLPGTLGAGYVLDGWGGLHPFGPVGGVLPAATTGAYWQGWDIARDVVASPTSTPAAPAGWVLDGWGGIHPFGAAGVLKTSAYWGGSDIGHSVAAH